MNRVIENYRDHPTLRYDSIKIVFKIEGKVYAIIDDVVRQIIPRTVSLTNIGDPYRKLIRLEFVFADNPDDEYGEYADFHPDFETELRQLL